MNTFYLIRHGQKEKIQGDPGLTAMEINKILKVKIFYSEKLKERANWGDVKNQSFDDFIKD